MADDNYEQWIKNTKDKKIVDAVIEINGKIQDLLEHKRSKSEKVSMPTATCIKKALDHVLKLCNSLAEENTAMKARLEERD